MAFGHVVFGAAGLHAAAAADAAVHINGHEPFVLEGIVAGGGGRGGEKVLHAGFAGAGGGQGQDAADYASQLFQDVAAGDLVTHGTSVGWWGTWHSVQRLPV